ncbi:phytanoyl-CoA dioxygenase [Mangrovimicrobium sediminis]|uniref:Phytanoyl-CoA dioxygenase n=1 Tax=Mangrovimicrobium sediminis TaxID=2562682 RepID=A0A4Z0MA22_9GAMM|nr:phytanoyl-CoA dioxygenase family protein [Haliea sp. SAOS-164]TGD76247.1 phytanoyl-CoA dioxygenase [Haliea sp. SAOS-164]
MISFEHKPGTKIVYASTDCFDTEGFAVVPEVASRDDISQLSALCDELDICGAGSRNLLQLDWVKRLAAAISEHPEIRSLLPPDARAVQCTYFLKTADKNWLVPLHRDRSIPVQEQFAATDWTGWSRKEGTWFAVPPDRVLRQLVAVRLHLEENSADNGALEVLPGSHRNSAGSGSRIACPVPAGGALVMKPSILHASSRLSSGRRRVLHFLYGPASLPAPAQWAYSI